MITLTTAEAYGHFTALSRVDKERARKTPYERTIGLYEKLGPETTNIVMVKEL